MADIAIETYFGLPCHCKLFTINGADADEDDFGMGHDGNTDEHYVEYGCWNHTWKRYEDSGLIYKAMQKYHISYEEYEMICEKLECDLSVGHCAWCQ